MEHIRNIQGISINIYDIEQSETKNTGAAFGGAPMGEGGRPIGSVFLIILYHKYLWIY